MDMDRQSPRRQINSIRVVSTFQGPLINGNVRREKNAAQLLPIGGSPDCQILLKISIKLLLDMIPKYP